MSKLIAALAATIVITCAAPAPTFAGPLHIAREAANLGLNTARRAVDLGLDTAEGAAHVAKDAVTPDACERGARRFRDSEGDWHRCR